ncbi:MAG: hypothetical protein GXO42_02645 [bacterium]|nr:hypothetical protein [bacterium]
MLIVDKLEEARRKVHLCITRLSSQLTETLRTFYTEILPLARDLASWNPVFVTKAQLEQHARLVILNSVNERWKQLYEEFKHLALPKYKEYKIRLNLARKTKTSISDLQAELLRLAVLVVDAKLDGRVALERILPDQIIDDRRLEQQVQLQALQRVALSLLSGKGPSISLLVQQLSLLVEKTYLGTEQEKFAEILARCRAAIEYVEELCKLEEKPTAVDLVFIVFCKLHECFAALAEFFYLLEPYVHVLDHYSSTENYILSWQLLQLAVHAQLFSLLLSKYLELRKQLEQLLSACSLCCTERQRLHKQFLEQLQQAKQEVAQQLVDEFLRELEQ